MRQERRGREIQETHCHHTIHMLNSYDGASCVFYWSLFKGTRRSWAFYLCAALGETVCSLRDRHMSGTPTAALGQRRSLAVKEKKNGQRRGRRDGRHYHRPPAARLAAVQTRVLERLPTPPEHAANWKSLRDTDGAQTASSPSETMPPWRRHGRHDSGSSDGGGGSEALDVVHDSSIPQQRRDTNADSAARQRTRLGGLPQPRVGPTPAAAAATPASARRAAVVLWRLALLPAAAPAPRRLRQPRNRQLHPLSPPPPPPPPPAVAGTAAAPASADGRNAAALGTRRRRGRDTHRRHC